MTGIDRFEIFTYIAQAETMTQAAEQLTMSKASLSKQIKRLEADLKLDLFSRVGNRLKLTPQGEVLLTQCLRLKRELDDTRSVCQQFSEEPEGSLKIVAFVHFANALIFPRLKDFLKRYPKLSITIDTSERVPQFEQEQVDLAVGFSLPMPDSENIIQCSMGTTYYVLCGSPKYFAKHGKPKTLEDLQHHHYISHIVRKKNYIKLQPGHEISLTPYLFVNSVASLIECAIRDLGLIQLPIYMMEELLKEKKLISVLQDYQRTGEHIYYYYPKYRYIQTKVRKFIDYFLK